MQAIPVGAAATLAADQVTGDANKTTDLHLCGRNDLLPVSRSVVHLLCRI